MAHTAQCSSYPRCRALCRRRQQVDPPRRAQSRQVHRGHHHPTPLSRTAGNRNLYNMLFIGGSLESPWWLVLALVGTYELFCSKRNAASVVLTM